MIYLIRHAEPLGELLGPEDYLIPDEENRLSEYGWQQAQQLAAMFSQIKIDEIYSSPILRAFQTAGVMAENTGVSIQIIDHLAERNFMPSSPITLKQCQDIQLQGYWHTNAVIQGVESVAAHRLRVANWFSGLEAEIQNKPEYNRLIVCHGGTIEHILGVMMNIPVSAMSRYFFSCECAHFMQIQPLRGLGESVVYRIDRINAGVI
ncbi:histidine phosphatase family protein [Parachitinimonas caeni]|uniref:Histidine phosphatase family protein n=1 Tax=Parachitinimonas caeni TaxID=3031301 RepID=A0ABT7E1P2_9NEIS|nr:histidine phosphatase family protein [Parachitinimonas caeni]MDK2125964.1 histidine phosphatase family protein [Parachitinimonas caeni]